MNEDRKKAKIEEGRNIANRESKYPAGVVDLKRLCRTRYLAIQSHKILGSEVFDDMIDAATIEKQALSLDIKERGHLASVLLRSLGELDAPAGREVEKTWIVESEHRYAAFQRGELEALPGDEVMARVRQRIK